MFVAAAATAAAAADDDDDGAAAADAVAATVAVLHSVEIFLVHISIAAVACGLSCLVFPFRGWAWAAWASAANAAIMQILVRLKK